MLQFAFRNILPDKCWDKIECQEECTCFHSRYWSAYLNEIGYKPYVLEVLESNEDTFSFVGFFIGVRIWRGVWIIAAPFDGIGTYTQGLVLDDKFVRTKNNITDIRLAIYKQLSDWIFSNRIASYIQVDDWQLRINSSEWIPYESFHHNVIEAYSLNYTFRPTLYLDMGGKTEEDLWSLQHYKSCKYSVNKARKLGLSVRRITNKNDIDVFIEKHYDQLCEVCAKQGMRPKPSQSKKRMKALCNSLFPNHVIMLECVGIDTETVTCCRDEVIMSTGIFCIGKAESIYWTGASYQRYQKYCPNELMVWEAIRILNQQDTRALNFGGMANYKLKFGSIYAYVPRLYFSKYSWIHTFKSFAKNVYFGVRGFVAKIKGRKSFK